MPASQRARIIPTWEQPLNRRVEKITKTEKFDEKDTYNQRAERKVYNYTETVNYKIH